MNAINISAGLRRASAIVSCLLTIFAGFPAMAQTSENRILVLGDAIEEVSANQATLNINLSYSDERDSKLAYVEHQQARQQLTLLLKQLNVPDSNVRFLQLLSRKGRDYQRGQNGERFTTYQRVLVKFDDLMQYTQVQQALAANGFTDLTAAFSVSNQREIESRLLDKALARAQEKAAQLAKASSRSIKRILRISDVGENEGFYGYRDFNRNNQSPNVINYDGDAIRQMATIPQLFRYAAAVKVEFELN